jgi:tetratricopeptide (TPR) repeat protein
MDALSVDPLSASAWIGLGSLRMMLDDPEEAERVYTAAIDHIPTLAPALAGRARARWKLGKHRAAEIDMQRYTDETSDQGAMRELSSWYSTDGRLPAELALWRRLQAMAIGRDDSVAVGEARSMILALMLLVSTADPVSQPVEPDRTRADLAAIARHCFGRP